MDEEQEFAECSDEYSSSNAEGNPPDEMAEFDQADQEYIAAFDQQSQEYTTDPEQENSQYAEDSGANSEGELDESEYETDFTSTDADRSEWQVGDAYPDDDWAAIETGYDNENFSSDSNSSNLDLDNGYDPQGINQGQQLEGYTDEQDDPNVPGFVYDWRVRDDAFELQNYSFNNTEYDLNNVDIGETSDWEQNLNQSQADADVSAEYFYDSRSEIWQPLESGNNWEEELLSNNWQIDMTNQQLIGDAELENFSGNNREEDEVDTSQNDGYSMLALTRNMPLEGDESSNLQNNQLDTQAIGDGQYATNIVESELLGELLPQDALGLFNTNASCSDMSLESPTVPIEQIHEDAVPLLHANLSTGSQTADDGNQSLNAEPSGTALADAGKAGLFGTGLLQELTYPIWKQLPNSQGTPTDFNLSFRDISGFKNPTSHGYVNQVDSLTGNPNKWRGLRLDYGPNVSTPVIDPATGKTQVDPVTGKNMYKENWHWNQNKSFQAFGKSDHTLAEPFEEALGKTLKAAKPLGRAALVTGVALDTWSLGNEISESVQTGNWDNSIVEGSRIAGGWAGGWAGAEAGGGLGATIGTVIMPGLGTVVGGAVGGLIGGAVGYFSGSEVGKTIAEKATGYQSPEQ
ncbi:hypothetical protein [Gloeobacter kilaueensis]|uniref:Mu-like prophage protein n=1 Tax=Gloeobacter kilaueensis (strain ATCC BAA-2537 / CCAP 1431/1 / ULC 316 / JS1) TaxID=1183438 RepID=U5QNP6_GLOK1|nr:hypothetical protein [Gloeobacter kilaueensis]AGY60498.1 Mu-like prophage protein [Gloeobacter kilaueensis JS1]